MAAKKKQDPAASEEEVTKTAASEAAASEAPAEETAAAAPEAEKPTGDSEKYLRLMAEFDNYKKRSVRERENIYTDVRVDTVTRFLPVYDNLERALKTETSDEAYKKGVEMTFNQLCEVFKKLGVEPIESIGQPFDPNMHNAVMHVEDDAFGENEIVDEFQKGFKIGEKIIRFSMVKVAN